MGSRSPTADGPERHRGAAQVNALVERTPERTAGSFWEATGAVSTGGEGWCQDPMCTFKSPGPASQARGRGFESHPPLSFSPLGKPPGGYLRLCPKRRLERPLAARQARGWAAHYRRRLELPRRPLPAVQRRAVAEEASGASAAVPSLLSVAVAIDNGQRPDLRHHWQVERKLSWQRNRPKPPRRSRHWRAAVTDAERQRKTLGTGAPDRRAGAVCSFVLEKVVADGDTGLSGRVARPSLHVTFDFQCEVEAMAA